MSTVLNTEMDFFNIAFNVTTEELKGSNLKISLITNLIHFSNKPKQFFISETSHVSSATRGGGGEDSGAREGDEPGDQGSHRKPADRKRCPHKRSRNSQRNDKGLI